MSASATQGGHNKVPVKASKDSLRFKHGATLPCDLSLITIVSRCRWFSDVTISQYSVATRPWCDWIFSYCFIRNLLLSLIIMVALCNSEDHNIFIL